MNSEILWVLRFPPPIKLTATNKTDRHDITDILLNVALNTINPSPDFRAFIVLSHLFVPVLLNTLHNYVR